MKILRSNRWYHARPHPDPLPRGEGTALASLPIFRSRWCCPPTHVWAATADDSPSPGGEGRGEGGRYTILFALVLFVAASSSNSAAAENSRRIDRHALVTRHNVELRQFDVENPLSVGNGEFAFTVDATGLQTFPELFTNTIPLGTLSQWGWHTAPNPDGWSIEKFQFKEFDVFGRKVGYADVPGNKRTPEINWLRANPHRLHLGQVGFVFTRGDGRAGTTNDLTNMQQALDLWSGVVVSRYQFEGEPVMVETVCHPTRDLLAVRVCSPLVKSGRLGLQVHFPYGTGSTVTADWTKPEAHETVVKLRGKSGAEFARRLDYDSYRVSARWSSGATLREEGRHRFLIAAGNLPLTPARSSSAGQRENSTMEARFEPLSRGAPISRSAHSSRQLRTDREIGAPGQDEGGLSTLEFVCEFTPTAKQQSLPSFESVLAASRVHWKNFWTTGGAIDLSGSEDPRWFELERRIVLSQYLTAIQCSGRLPPQETGLTYNSWEGKFHLEMHWWHAAQFALWNRLPMLEQSLGYYEKILPSAQATAKRQGYTGARWPKMTSASGDESPSPVGPFLVWQQPHPIFYAELCYRQHPTRATLKRFAHVVMETAEFMASYPEWDKGTSRFVLGPVLQCAQEIFPKDQTLNPTFELTYWRWGLETAQLWRERLGMPRRPQWDTVVGQLAKPPVETGRYLFAETATSTYTKKRWMDDHPSVLASLGVLPGPGIDPDAMARTLDWIWQNWNWPDTWGWDYGMTAMTAARLGETEMAVAALLRDTPKNFYRVNGHNHQRPGLTIYLPGNGSLLYATAMMCAGWDGGPKRPAPGFPDNGKWQVRYENLRVAP